MFSAQSSFFRYRSHKPGPSFPEVYVPALRAGGTVAVLVSLVPQWPGLLAVLLNLAGARAVFDVSFLHPTEAAVTSHHVNRVKLHLPTW